MSVGSRRGPAHSEPHEGDGSVGRSLGKADARSNFQQIARAANKDEVEVGTSGRSQVRRSLQ